jgi:hypothetical protein
MNIEKAFKIQEKKRKIQKPVLFLLIILGFEAIGLKKSK